MRGVALPLVLARMHGMPASPPAGRALLPRVLPAARSRLWAGPRRCTCGHSYGYNCGYTCGIAGYVAGYCGYICGGESGYTRYTCGGSLSGVLASGSVSGVVASGICGYVCGGESGYSCDCTCGYTGGGYIVCGTDPLSGRGHGLGTAR